MKCTSKEWDNCRVEKMGCPGCYYNDDSLEKAEKYLKYKIENDFIISRHNPKDYEVIETILKRVDYYQEKAEKYKFMLHNDVISKKRIRDKIKYYKDLKRQMNNEGYDCTEFTEGKIEVLQEILEGK